LLAIFGSDPAIIQIGATYNDLVAIQYVATDPSDLTSTSTRTVIVEAPANDNAVATSTAATSTAQ
jgi:hypothetical protein